MPGFTVCVYVCFVCIVLETQSKVSCVGLPFPQGVTAHQPMGVRGAELKDSYSPSLN